MRSHFPRQTSGPKASDPLLPGSIGVDPRNRGQIHAKTPGRKLPKQIPVQDHGRNGVEHNVCRGKVLFQLRHRRPFIPIGADPGQILRFSRRGCYAAAKPLQAMTQQLPDAAKAQHQTALSRKCSLLRRQTKGTFRRDGGVGDGQRLPAEIVLHPMLFRHFPVFTLHLPRQDPLLRTKGGEYTFQRHILFSAVQFPCRSLQRKRQNDHIRRQSRFQRRLFPQSVSKHGMAIPPQQCGQFLLAAVSAHDSKAFLHRSPSSPQRMPTQAAGCIGFL